MTNEEWHIFSHREHRWTEHTKVRKIAAPPPTPPPKGRGVITEIPMWGGCRLLFASLSVSTIAETLCVLCMPKAFCGLETCAKMLSELCALCERKNLYEVCKQPNRGNLTYYAPPCGGGVGGGATSSWARNSTQKSSVKSVGSVREKNLRHERKEYLLWEKNLPCDSQKCSFSHREHRRTEDTGFIERGLPSLDPNRSPLRVLLFKPTSHCLVVPSLSLQQVFSVVKNHYISPN